MAHPPGIRENAQIVKPYWSGGGFKPKFGTGVLASVLQERKNRKGRRLRAEAADAAANPADPADPPLAGRPVKPISPAPVSAVSPIGNLPTTPGQRLGGAQFTRYMGRHRALPVPPMSLVREARNERSAATADLRAAGAHVADVARAGRASQSGMPWLGRLGVAAAETAAVPESAVPRIGAGVYALAKGFEAHNARSRSQTVAAQNSARNIQGQIEHEIDQQSQINTTPYDDQRPDLHPHPNTKILPDHPDQHPDQNQINTTPATRTKPAKPGAHKKPKNKK